MINASAEKHGVPAQALASIMFQEKLKGGWADMKNTIALPKLATADASSYSGGIMEMQIQLAQRLAGDVSIDAAITLLSHDHTAIDLAAMYVKELMIELGTNDPTVIAQAYNLGPEKTKAGYYSNVGLRSKDFQFEISEALQGNIINSKKKEPK